MKPIMRSVEAEINAICHPVIAAIEDRDDERIGAPHRLAPQLMASYTDSASRCE
jgi:hypothetical protein